MQGQKLETQEAKTPTPSTEGEKNHKKGG